MELRDFYLSWKLLEQVCDAYACAIELSDDDLARLLHKAAIRVAPRIGATPILVDEIERDRVERQRAAARGRPPR
jgi:hypothetical protein